MTTSFDDSQEANQLCYAWGKIWDQHTLILINPQHNFNRVSLEQGNKSQRDGTHT